MKKKYVKPSLLAVEFEVAMAATSLPVGDDDATLGQQSKSDGDWEEEE